jgi:ribokinase
MDKIFDIITVGSATVDVFLHTASDQSELLNVHHHPDLCYRLGAKILVKNIDFYTGGGGTNTAVAFSRIGLHTGFLGRLGDDANSDIIMKNLIDENVTFIGYKKGISGYSVIMDSVADDRTIFTFKGCNNDLQYHKINKKVLNTGWFYFSSMMDKSFASLRLLSIYAKKRGIKIAFNPSLYLAKKGKDYLRTILRHCEILIFNKEEAQAILNHEYKSIFVMLDKLSHLGPKIIIITDGKNGANCYDTYTGMFYIIKPAKVKIVETTGAGDAFASGFVSAKIIGKDTVTALKVGMKNAESVIQHNGAKNNLLGNKIFDMAIKDKRQVYALEHNFR